MSEFAVLALATVSGGNRGQRQIGDADGKSAKSSRFSHTEVSLKSPEIALFSSQVRSELLLLGRGR